MSFVNITVIDIIDIVLAALLMFYFYKLIRGTRAANIIIGILIIYVLWILVRALNMELLSTILNSIISVGILSLIIIFQPEIRQFLDMIGDKWRVENKVIQLFFPSGKTKSQSSSMEQIVQACKEMSARRTGALIVIKRDNNLEEIINTGVIIDAQISAPLIMNLFFKNSPLHDGAVIINGNRIVAAKCILPSTQNEVPFHFGMRHRAAVGLCENYDALVIVVSEETGSISIAINGNIDCNIPPHALAEELKLKLDKTQQNKKERVES